MIEQPTSKRLPRGVVAGIANKYWRTIMWDEMLDCYILSRPGNGRADMLVVRGGRIVVWEPDQITFLAAAALACEMGDAISIREVVCTAEARPASNEIDAGTLYQILKTEKN